MLKSSKTIHLVIFPASCVDNPIRSGMNTYSISLIDSRRCSCTVAIIFVSIWKDKADLIHF